MRLVWLTDLHLNFVKDGPLMEFFREVVESRPNIGVVTGDIGESRDVTEYLERMDEAAGHLARVLPLALATHEHVVLATHVPPFREACWHEGNLSDDE